MLYAREKLRQQLCAPYGWETGRHEIQPEICDFTRSSGGNSFSSSHVHAKGSKGASWSVAGYTRDTAGVSSGERLEKAFFSLDYLCWQLEEPAGPRAAPGVGCGQAAAGCVLRSDAVTECWIPPQMCKTSPRDC